MASAQEKETIEEVSNVEAEKSKQESPPVVEEKWTPNEEPEVFVHEGDPDEDHDQEQSPDQKLAIVDDDDEPTASFDVVGDAEAEAAVEESQADAI